MRRNTSHFFHTGRRSPHDRDIYYFCMTKYYFRFRYHARAARRRHSTLLTSFSRQFWRACRYGPIKYVSIFDTRALLYDAGR